MTEFIAYIDEAGDEGFGKLKDQAKSGGQSKWLAIGCCIVSAENDRLLPSWKRDIIARFPKRQAPNLHFRDLNHAQKVVVCQELATRKIGAAVVLSNKTTIPDSRWGPVFKQKGYLYNYLVRWLLERVTSECDRASKGGPCRLHLVFSRRGGTDYHSMREYLLLMRDGREKMRPVRSIHWRVLDIDSIVVEEHDRWAGLQFADCVTSAFHAGVEPNAYGNYDQGYGRLLKPNVLHHSGHCHNVGLTAVPSMHRSNLDEHQKAFFEFFKPEEK